ncbi:MAG: Fe-S cluster assembly protein SufD [Solirubrobacteraceae bacterium]|jgi:Fe-S cluster assembly protein SufD|nr:Fe-S cluster assembly protein SufD [Solirubrobacteraceae bacterium]
MTTTSASPTWLSARRERAAAALGAIEVPSFRGVAGWEFTPIDKLDVDAYPPAPGGEGPSLFQFDDAVLSSDEEHTVEGPIIMPLAVAAERYPDLVEAHLGSVVTQQTPFTTRNDAHWTDGTFVYVPRNVEVDAPIVLSTIHEQAGTTLHWRALIVLEEGAQAEVWHEARSADPAGEGILNGVVELVVGQNARLRFVDSQDMSETSWVFGAQRATVARDATLDWITLGFGSANGKVFQETQLAGPGAHGKVTGAYASRGRQHLDFDTLQEHAAEDTTSDLAFRGILADRSSAVWRGMIKVDPGAQRTDAFQESRNLLLSKKAHADAIPGLEILANDVRCTHAAAIAQIDKEQLFYLRSHGLPEPDANRLVIEGFLQALVERFEEGPVRDRVGAAIERRLEAVLGS